ncbi:MAG: hypothetical protein FJ004_00100 [Chloroflexi bacterium]|nr:hypothetical protein [Chloroflexota bacterium]
MTERRCEFKYEPDEKGAKVVNRSGRRNFMSFSVLIGLEIILLGVVLFLWAQDILSDKETLAYFLLGLGGIFLLDAIARYARLGPRSLMWCRITVSLVLLSAGGAVLGGIGTWWPLIIILIGAALLLNSLLTFFRRG